VWEAARAGVATSLGHDLDPHRELAEFATDLDAAYRAVANRLQEKEAVRIETADGHGRLVLTPLDRLEEPPSLLALQAGVADLLPRVDLPDVLLEVAGWTGFLTEFTHVSEGTARAEDLGVSICAVLVAAACNTGLEPVVQPGSPALTRGRLSWVDQNYLRGDTITAATGRMVDAQGKIQLAQQWGGGDVASADGLRFIVPVRTLNAGPNPRYFGPGRGVTYLNFLSDQFAGFHAIVVPGTLRDSLYILDGLLEQQTTLQPTEPMTDTAGYAVTWTFPVPSRRKRREKRQTGLLRRRPCGSCTSVARTVRTGSNSSTMRASRSSRCRGSCASWPPLVVTPPMPGAVSTWSLICSVTPRCPPRRCTCIRTRPGCERRWTWRPAHASRSG
jgi:hypothetical protein